MIPGARIDDILPLALNDGEISERRVVFENVGQPSDYFCGLTRAARSESGEFVGEGPENPEAALSLLQPLQEEEGVIVALFASLFCLSKLNENPARYRKAGECKALFLDC
jgi:hypothetical protein